MAAGSWRVVGASVQGVSHRRANIPCQDAHLWRLLPDGGIVAAVADGAGSAMLAEVGARLAVEAAVENVLACFQGAAEHGRVAPKEAIQSGFRAALAALTIEADAKGHLIDDLATTLLLAVGSAEDVTVGQIGDGAVVCQPAGGTLTPLTLAGQSEFLNATSFVTSERALERMHIHHLPGPIEGLALISDGLQMLALKMPEGLPHPPFFAPLWQFLRSAPDVPRAQQGLESFLSSPRLAERVEDDVTLVLAVPDNASESKPPQKI